MWVFEEGQFLNPFKSIKICTSLSDLNELFTVSVLFEFCHQSDLPGESLEFLIPMPHAYKDIPYSMTDSDV